MNVTLNTFNKQNYNLYNKRNNQSFTANPANTIKDTAGVVVEQAAKEKSNLFAPFEKFYDSFTDKIAKHFTSKVVDSKPMNWLTDKLKNSDNLYKHCLTLGSLITSGLYVEKTLTNDKLDKDRKNTLAVNQGLTFLLSTIGAYSLDNYLKTWWENVTAKYIGLQLDDKNFNKDFRDLKSAIKQVNNGLKNDKNADAGNLVNKAKTDLKMSENSSTILERTLKKAEEIAEGKKVKSLSSVNLNSFIDKLVKDKKMPALPQELSNKVKGMGLLRQMLVFGFVYRYFVPVVVTKPSNWLGDKYLEHKKAKQAQKINQA